LELSAELSRNHHALAKRFEIEAAPGNLNRYGKAMGAGLETFSNSQSLTEGKS
jgi:hypothetical protein